MLLADFVVVWVGGLLLIGFVGFFALLVVAVVRVFRSLFRVLFGSSCNADPTEDPPSGETVKACPQLRCGYLNPGHARYCARCGHPLDGVDDVDRYG